ncbi:hypothetical protein [Achromobacter sp. DH1f]|uniref:hypothetical protein n=1 Tax=Achromobacter sp. DH1f TaxID=1397275 RepID=UPI00046B067B|nr:hypothetical protein [Achromobacter sp. DH1f]
MTDEQLSNETLIRAAFEAALIKGLNGQPLTNKDGAITDADGVVLLGAPEASFLSVVRAYLKDLEKPGDGKGKPPQQGKPTALMESFMNSPAGKKLPFANQRVQ